MSASKSSGMHRHALCGQATAAQLIDQEVVDTGDATRGRSLLVPVGLGGQRRQFLIFITLLCRQLKSTRAAITMSFTPKVRRLVLTGAVTIITITGTIYGAQLKMQQDVTLVR